MIGQSNSPIYQVAERQLTDIYLELFMRTSF